MKRFTWPLQSLLDLTVQREKILRVEVYALARDILGVRSNLAQRRANLRARLIEQSQQDISERLAGQVNFGKYAQAEEKKIRALSDQLTELELQRNEKISKLNEVKTSRDTLEEKRQEAKADHAKAMSKHEQKQLDEVAHVSFTRKIIAKNRTSPAAHQAQAG